MVEESEPFLITFPMAAIAFFFGQSVIYFSQIAATVTYCVLFMVNYETEFAPFDGLLFGIDFAAFALNIFLVAVSLWYDEVNLLCYLHMIASGYVANFFYTLRILQTIYIQAPILAVPQTGTKVAQVTFSELYFYGCFLALLVHCAEVVGFTVFCRFYRSKMRELLKAKTF